MTAFIRLRPHPELHDGEGRLVCPLAPQETTLLFLVMCRRRVHLDEMAEALWPDPDDMPDQWNNVLTSVLCNLRRKLRPFGIGIRNETKRRRWSLVCPQDARRERYAA